MTNARSDDGETARHSTVARPERNGGTLAAPPSVYGRGVGLRGRGSSPGGGHGAATRTTFSSKRVARAYLLR